MKEILMTVAIGLGMVAVPVGFVGSMIGSGVCSIICLLGVALIACVLKDF